MGVNFCSGVVSGRVVQAANGIETGLREVTASPSICFILQSGSDCSEEIYHSSSLVLWSAKAVFMEHPVFGVSPC